MADEADRKFEIICQYKDTCSSNLNEVFASYGCDTLEAKVPVVKGVLVEQMFQETEEQQLYHKLAFKSKSAADAMDGRPPRTRNSQLKVVEIKDKNDKVTDLIIATTKVYEEEEPVDPAALDEELEQYMNEAARVRASRLAGELAMPINTLPKSDDLLTAEEMDDDLDQYMKEAFRQRAQKKLLAEQTDRQRMMERMEEDFDLDHDTGI